MPRSTFSTGALGGATPGLSRLALALGGGDGAYDAGADAETTRQTRMAQALASIRASDAASRYHDAEAGRAGAETGILAGRPDQVANAIADSTGSTRPEVDAYAQFRRTGVMPTLPQTIGPPTEDGTGPQPIPALAQDKMTRIAQAASRLLPFLANKGDVGFDSYAKGMGEFRNQDLSTGVINGQLPRNTVAGAQAAAEGKPMFHLDGSGATLDQYGGQVDTSNPMAGASIGLKTAQAGEQRAAAAHQLAGADAQRASAARTRQEIEQGVKTGQLKLEHDADGNIVVVDMAKGTATAAKDPVTGLPVKSGGTGKPLTETQGKATTFASRMQDAESTIQQLEAQGVSGKDLRTRAAASDWSNWLASPQGQQYRQAQENWVTANLRQESGAAIGVAEMDKDVRKFFPSLGDKPEVIAQKARARQVAQRGMLAQAGPGAAKVPGIVGQPAPQTGGATGTWTPGTSAGGFTYLGKEGG